MQLDDGTFDALEKRAAAAGMEVSEFVSQVVTDDDHKRRFLEAAEHFTALFTPVFAEQFGYPTAARGAQAP